MKRNLKNLSRIFILCMVALIAIALVGCGGGKNPNGGKTEPGENELFWDADGNGTPDWQEKEITLRYATWQYNNPDAVTIDTLLIEEFMKKYPNFLKRKAQ